MQTDEETTEANDEETNETTDEETTEANDEEANDEKLPLLNINKANDRLVLKQRLFEDLHNKATTCDNKTSPAFYRLLLQLIDLVETPKNKGAGDGIDKLLEEVRNNTNEPTTANKSTAGL